MRVFEFKSMRAGMGIVSRIEALWWKKEQPPLLLRGLSVIYAAISACNLNRRHKRAIEPSLPMISVGNITVGGSGKTPFVIWLCGELQQRGYQPVVLCRGDGGTLKKPRHLRHGDQASLVGDEALLLARRCNAPVIAGRDRIESCRMAAKLGDVIILDDGFQYRQLKRHCDIVLIPCEGVGNGCQIPAGPLREPLNQLQRADLIVRSGNGDAVPPEYEQKPEKEWLWQSKATNLVQIAGPKNPSPIHCTLTAAIARPERFIQSVESSITLENTIIYSDHHRYTSADVNHIIASGLPVLCTEKDAVKLLPLWPDQHQLWVLPIAGEGEQGLPEAIIKTMLSHLKE